MPDANAWLHHLERAWASPPDASHLRTAVHGVFAVETQDPCLSVEECLCAATASLGGKAHLVTDTTSRPADGLEVATTARVEALDAATSSRPLA